MNAGDSVLVCFAVCGCEPLNPQMAERVAKTDRAEDWAGRDVVPTWKVRRILAVTPASLRAKATVRVMNYHLSEPIEVPIHWVREIPL
jgi:hypothetical protein